MYLPLLFSGFIISIGPSCTFTDKLFASDCRSLGSPSVSDPLWFSAEAKSGRGHPRLPSDPLPPSKQTKRPMFLGISNDSQQLELNRHISFILLKQPFSLDLGTPLPHQNIFPSSPGHGRASKGTSKGVLLGSRASCCLAVRLGCTIGTVACEGGEGVWDAWRP